MTSNKGKGDLVDYSDDVFEKPKENLKLKQEPSSSGITTTPQPTMTTTLQEFNPIEMEWNIYEERLKQFFLCNDITTEVKKASNLLTRLNGETFKILRDLVSPEKLETKKYDDLCKIFTCYFKKMMSQYMIGMQELRKQLRRVHLVQL